MSEAYGIFAGAIDNAAVERFAKGFASAIGGGCTHAHILFQSGGGIAGDGVCLYNLFKAMPIELTLYNGGTICSAAAVAYLGAKNRIFSRHATFMLHPSRSSPQAMSGADLKNGTKTADLEDNRMEAIVRETTTVSEEQVAAFRSRDLWFSSDEALQAGIATSIGEFTPPKGQMVPVL